MPTKVLRVLAGLLFIAALTFSLNAFRVNPTTAGFAYIILVLLFAARWGLVEAVTASLAAAFCLNYFFLPPVRTLNIADTHNWVAFSAFLVTSLVASQLSETARRRNRQLQQRQKEIEQLYALSRGIMLIDSDKPAGVQIAAEVVRTYDVAAVTIYDQADGQCYVAGIEAAKAAPDSLRELSAREGTTVDTAGNSCMSSILLAGRSIGAVAIEGQAGHDLPSKSALQAITNLIAVGMEKARTRELASRAEAARQSDLFKSTLLDSVAHEFKTPLTSIKAATSTILAANKLTPAQQLELITIIDQESGRLTGMVTEAIHLARVESGKLHLSRTRRDVKELVEEALRQSSSITGGRDIQAQFAEGLPPISVDVELFAVMMKQLLDNATKYSSAGTPIRITAESSTDSVRIRIHNQGLGLSESERTKVFERFYRTPDARQNAPGTGMGLAIVRDIVRAHGGFVDVESELGVGTEFCVRFPRIKGERQ